MRQAQAVAGPRHRRQVGDADEHVLARILAGAREGDDVGVGVVGLDPVEAAPVEVDLVERRRLAVHAVQIAHERLDAGVLTVLEQMPVQRAVVAPLRALRELLAHEEQLLAGMRPHVGVQAAQVGELLPAVAGHLVDQRALAVDDLVVRQRQDEVLAERVDERERQLVVVVAAVDRVLLEVVQRVVHPAHVPLESEAQAAEIRRARDARPRRRLLGRADDARLVAMQDLVELLEEGDRLEVLAPAELVGHPLARLARVVEVEHRGDGVHADPVGMELARPEQRVGEQEVLDLVAPVVEDERAPVGVRAAARVLVLVERRAVEASERPGVAREVRRHPVQQHADAVLVHAVDEAAEVVGRAEVRRRRVVRGHLVAPGAAERVGHHGQQLDVREAEVGHVGRQLVGELGVGQRAVVLQRVAPPRAEVHLVGRHRLVVRRAGRARGEVRVVAPLVGRLVHDRRRLRRQLGLERERVGLQQQLAGLRADLELVARAVADGRHEQLPDARAAERAHHVQAPVPEVEVADDGDRARGRCPDRERRALHAVQLAHVGAHLRPQLLVAALAEEVLVEV